jgi:hypothetical protein
MRTLEQAFRDAGWEGATLELAYNDAPQSGSEGTFRQDDGARSVFAAERLASYSGQDPAADYQNVAESEQFYVWA